MEDRALSQRALSGRSGVALGTISEILNSDYSPDIETLLRLSEAKFDREIMFECTAPVRKSQFIDVEFSGWGAPSAGQWNGCRSLPSSRESKPATRVYSRRLLPMQGSL